MADAARMPGPATSPTTSATVASGRGNTSNPSPPVSMRGMTGRVPGRGGGGGAGRRESGSGRPRPRGGAVPPTDPGQPLRGWAGFFFGLSSEGGGRPSAAPPHVQAPQQAGALLILPEGGD